MTEPYVVRLEKRARRRTFLDVYDEDYCYVWCAWVPDGTWDVDFERIDHDSVGTVPSWWEWAREGLDDYSMGKPTSDRDGRGLKVVDWLLREGIAPGQPFRCRVGCPTSTVSHTQDGTEYDDEYDVEIVEVYPWPAKRVLASFLRFRRNAVLSAQEVEASILARDQALRSSRDLRVVYDVYFTRGQSTYDDMCVPNGVSVRLESKIPDLPFYTPIAHARSDEGSHAKALFRLQAEVLVTLPALGDIDVTKLPRGHR